VRDHQSKIKEASIDALVSTEEEKKEKRQKIKEREFWERLSNVISDKTFEVWGVLETELKRFNDELNGRAELLEQVDEIRNQNEELRRLLNQYLSSKINEDLVVPPVTL